MNEVVIWKQENGVIAIFTPSPEILNYFTMQEIAKRIVPTGVPYKIIDSAIVPPDIDNWVLPDEYFDDGIGEG